MEPSAKLAARAASDQNWILINLMRARQAAVTAPKNCRIIEQR